MKRALFISFASASVLLAIGIYLAALHRSIQLSLDLIVGAIFISLFIPGLTTWSEERRISSMEHGLIDYLADLAEAAKYSPNLARCVLEAPKGDYGPFNEEIESMKRQMEWGATFEEALEDLRGRIGSLFAERVITTLVELNRTGGNISEVMVDIARNSREAYLLQKEKYSQLSSYAAAVFIAFAVFLLAVVILDLQFFPAIVKASGGISTPVGYLNPSAIPTVKLAFTGMTIVNGIGGGIMAGILREGRIGKGLIYSSILLAAGYAILSIIGGV
ncbi:MAG: type II secretion system F family protein [Thermoplasmata archaeon]